MQNALTAYIEAARNARRVRDSALAELNAACDAARIEYDAKVKAAYDAEDLAYQAAYAEANQAVLSADKEGD